MMKCIRCGKPALQHRASDAACPVGSRHRTLGYTQYSDLCKLTIRLIATHTPEKTHEDGQQPR